MKRIHLLLAIIIVILFVIWKHLWDRALLDVLLNKNNKLQNDLVGDLEKFPDSFDENNNRIKRHVFFDLGTNNGDSIKYFMLPTTKSSNALHGYGAKTNFKWEIYAFEGNPLFEKQLNDLKAEFERNGHIFYLFAKSAASVTDGKVEFFLDKINKNNNFWSSSLESEQPSVIKSNRTKVTVQSYDVSKLIRRYSVDDEIIVKIDIEGSEFRLLKHFLTHDTYKYIDFIAVEFHRYIEPQGFLQNFLMESFKIFNIKYVRWL